MRGEHNTEHQELCMEASVKRSGGEEKHDPSQLVVDPRCPVYGDEETTEHMVFGCRWTELVWGEMLGVIQNDTHPMDVTRWLDERRREGYGITPHQETPWEKCMLTT